MRDQISDHRYYTSYFQLTGASYIYHLAGGGFVGGRSHGFFFFFGGGAFVVNRVLEGDSTNFVNLTANQGGEREGSSDPLGEE